MDNNPYEFNAVKILILGDLILDYYIFGEVERISPEAPVPIVKVEKEEYRLGGAANVAQNIKSLGGNAILVGLRGTEQISHKLRILLEKEGIKNILPPTPDYKISLKERIIGRCQQIVRVDWEEENPEKNLSDVAIEHAIREIKNDDSINAVIVSDYGKGTIGQTLPELIKACNKKKKPIIVDPKPINKEFYKNCTIITPNLKEAIEMAEVEEIEYPALFQKLKWISNTILVTEGKLGMSLYDGGYFTHFPAETKEIYDVTGAGDTVVAVFALCYASGMDLKESVRISNIAAGIVVKKQGAATLTKKELFGGGTIQCQSITPP